MDVPQSVWVVIDSKDGPEFAAAWREGAHEHIKDCLDEGIHEAARWVVREYALADELTRLRSENAALIAERDALLSVCRGVIAWDKAEENHEGTTFWQRMEMWRSVQTEVYAAVERHDAAIAAQGEPK